MDKRSPIPRKRAKALTHVVAAPFAAAAYRAESWSYRLGIDSWPARFFGMVRRALTFCPLCGKNEYSGGPCSAFPVIAEEAD